MINKVDAGAAGRLHRDHEALAGDAAGRLHHRRGGRGGGLPAGRDQPCPGAPRGLDYLVRNPGVDKVSFTGSTAAGRRIASVVRRADRPLTLELGGKSAAIVLDDSDIAAAAKPWPSPSRS